MDSSSVAPPCDDGSSTESECYDEELLALAQVAQEDENDQNAAPNSTVNVKLEAVESGDSDQISTNSSPTATVKLENATVKLEDAAASLETETKLADGKCRRCRRKLPNVTEQEQTDVQRGTLKTKRCACCEEFLPLKKFGKNNQSYTRAIPRCKSCAQAAPRVWKQLMKSPEYAEAFAAEVERRREENKKKRADLPHWERKTTKQRYEEQFEIVGGKTARARRLAQREEEKKKRLASIRSKQQENKKKKERGEARSSDGG